MRPCPCVDRTYPWQHAIGCDRNVYHHRLHHLRRPCRGPYLWVCLHHVLIRDHYYWPPVELPWQHAAAIRLQLAPARGALFRASGSHLIHVVVRLLPASLPCVRQQHALAIQLRGGVPRHAPGEQLLPRTQEGQVQQVLLASRCLLHQQLSLPRRQRLRRLRLPVLRPDVRHRLLDRQWTQRVRQSQLRQLPMTLHSEQPLLPALRHLFQPVQQLARQPDLPRHRYLVYPSVAHLQEQQLRLSLVLDQARQQ